MEPAFQVLVARTELVVSRLQLVVARLSVVISRLKLDERGVPHGEVRELTSFGICVVPFRDPDNIQLELTSPL